MAYVGTPIDTQNQFQSLQGKRFSGNGSTTAFTLDVAPTSVFDIEVFVENVRQDPNSAYSLNGTTLTFAAAPASGTNNIYVIHQAKAVGTIEVLDGAITTAKLGADAVTEAKIADDAVESEHLNDNIISGQTALAEEPADTDEFLVSDAGTLKRIDYSHIKATAATNTPSFHVYASSSQTVTAGAQTKVVFNTEVVDTDNAFASNTFTVPSGKGGKYLMYATVHNSNRSPSRYHVQIRQGNSEKLTLELGSTGAYAGTTVSGLVNASAGDTFDVYFYNNAASDMTIDGGISKMFFGGFKLT